VFDNQDKLPTDDIINGLVEIPESPWGTIRKGEPIDDRGLATRLRKYGITSKALRDGESVFKGYARAQFIDSWKRYVDNLIDDDDDDGCADGESVTSVTPVTEPVDDGLFVTPVTDVTDSRQPHCTTNLCGCGADLLQDNSTGLCAECMLIARNRIIAARTAEMGQAS
jgi:hypothetical protein